jgi:DHA2 family multidrug resistance protein-like MFS transporter
MRRPAVPGFVHEIVDDPRQRGILVSGSLVLFAVGLVPRVLSPGLPDVQQRLHEQPTVGNLYLLISFGAAAAVLLGGMASDLIRRRELLIGALTVMAASGLVCLFITSGPIYYVATFVGVVAGGVGLAYGIGAVAMAYEGVPRATALGVVYAAYGAGSALAPLLLTIVLVRIPSTVPGEPAGFEYLTWPAELATLIAAAIAFAAASRWMPRLPGSLPASRTLVGGVTLWSISILALVVGIFSFWRGGGPAIPLALIVLGVVGLATMSFRIDRTASEFDRLHLDRRAWGAALAVGVTLGVSQAAPMMVLPTVFERVLGYGQIFAMLAIAPFVIALLLAGPVSGTLLRRFGPRGMMTVGAFVIAIGDIVLWAIFDAVGRGAGYWLFVVPLVFIGAGFVVATTVRTAIVFASTPRGLSGMAAAVNEASVSLGARIGVLAATVLVGSEAISSMQSQVAGRPNAAALTSEFTSVLQALGTPRFQESIQDALLGAPAEKIGWYVTSYLNGVEEVLLVSGIVGIIGALLAWVLVGRRDPLVTVFDMKDERADIPAGTVGPAVGVVEATAAE